VRITEAGDGNEGLGALDREAFDLVVLDILMPRREGLETMREIRKRWATLPVLAISGGSRHAWCDFLRTASEIGADDTMAKPFLDREFVDRVTGLLGRGKS
jgi:DNA-binding response OmpR family regulator